MRTRVRKAFTLVEILIVVVILGILAAIVVPQFTNATQDAQAGNITSQLETMNNQLELFRARHNGYPDFSGDVWTTTFDAPNGEEITGGLVGAGYFKAAPVNPYNKLSEVVVSEDGDADAGWHWYDSTGDGIEDAMGASYFDEVTGKITAEVP
jgi:general secretion pathway protein G